MPISTQARSLSYGACATLLLAALAVGAHSAQVSGVQAGCGVCARTIDGIGRRPPLSRSACIMTANKVLGGRLHTPRRTTPERIPRAPPSTKTQVPCAAEEDCLAGGVCGHAYDHQAQDFPYTVTYTQASKAFSTVFTFEVGARARVVDGWCRFVPQFSTF